MVDPNTVRNVLGVIGNVISFGLFLSPLPTFIRIIKNKSVEQFKPDPYIATILNCAMWVLYGLPFVHPNNIFVATINGVGLGIEIIYISIFLIYPSWSKSVAYHKNSDDIHRGSVCRLQYYHVLFTVDIMKMVIKTKSVKYMPFGLSLTNFLNGACWT
ncbi:hypothetical protein RND81_05G199400, partial [Saponaria officinalis]